MIGVETSTEGFIAQLKREERESILDFLVENHFIEYISDSLGMSVEDTIEYIKNLD